MRVMCDCWRVLRIALNPCEASSAGGRQRRGTQLRTALNISASESMKLRGVRLTAISLLPSPPSSSSSSSLSSLRQGKVRHCQTRRLISPKAVQGGGVCVCVGGG